MGTVRDAIDKMYQQGYFDHAANQLPQEKPIGAFDQHAFDKACAERNALANHQLKGSSREDFYRYMQKEMMGQMTNQFPDKSGNGRHLLPNQYEPRDLLLIRMTHRADKLMQWVA